MQNSSLKFENKNLAAKYIKEVRENGYVLIKQANSPEVVAELLAMVKKVFAETKPLTGPDVPYLNRGHNMIYNLQSKDFLFVQAKLRHNLVREILTGLLNDEWYKQIPKENPNYIMRSMIARSGGEAALPLHIDSFIPSSGDYCWSAQVSFVLEDQSAANGCTIVVPKSHKSGRYVKQEDIVDAVNIESKAGDILIWDSRLWHGTTGNNTGKSRWAFISTYVRWWVKQNYQITETFPKEFYDKLTNEERAVIGYCSVPSRDEYDRIDIKSGYEIFG
jgi:ectoine hydroxylase-related dioxygenase (phytanoyl-CoA dioxygenase family)